MTYSEKLQDPRWQKKRLEILERDQWECRLCKDTTTTLHIHHLSYSSNNPWDTPNEDLITYCKHCHEVIEDMKSYISPDVVMKIDKNSQLIDEVIFIAVYVRANAFSQKLAVIFYDYIISENRLRYLANTKASVITTIYNSLQELKQKSTKAEAP